MKEQRYRRDRVPQFRAAYAMANGHSQREAARRSGLSTTTIWRWLRTDDFQDLVKKAQQNLEFNPDAETSSDRLDAKEAVAIFCEMAEEIKLMCKG